MKLQKAVGYRSNMILIEEGALSHSDVEQIIKRCTYANPVYMNAKRFARHGRVYAPIPPKLHFATITDQGHLGMYRGATVMLPPDLRERVEGLILRDARIVKPVKFPKLRLELNAEQNKCLAAFEQARANDQRPYGNYLFVASTAVGKTILQAVISARLKQHTMVICPTDLIMKAWVADLQKAFGFSEDAIGFIKRERWDLSTDYPFVLASIQTLGRRKELWSDAHKAFGTVVVDEVQGVSADTLFSYMSECVAQNIVGATATTQTRSGSRNLHLLALFGQPLTVVDSYQTATQSSLPIKEVKVVKTGFVFHQESDILNWNELSDAMSYDEARNSLIVENVKREWLEGRSVLIVTKRREHASLLADMLTELGIKNVNQINGDTNTDTAYTKRLLRAIETRVVTAVVATAQAIKTGANIPALDSLHLVIPPANARDMEQLLGRIRRKAEGKVDAIMTYYLDSKFGYLVSLFTRFAVPVFRKMQIPGYENQEKAK